MPFCTNCGKELSDGEKFCSNCGAATGVADNSKRTSVYDGELHKCPNCGEILKSFEINCPACGYELRSVKASSAVKEFASKLEAIEARREYEKPRGLFARAEALQRVSKADEQKISLIKSFAVPNSKEDILEFFILALSQIKTGGINTDAWMVKLEQAYQKAELSFDGTQEFERLKPMYENALQLNKKNSAVSSAKKVAHAIYKSKFFWPILLAVVGIFFLLINIGFDSPVLYGIGFVAIGVSLWIALYTEIDRMAETGKPKRPQKNKSCQSRGICVGEDAEDFYREYYEDVRERLKSSGFRNVVVKAEKKGLLDAEGAVKEISIAGISEFSADDTFDANAKVIIRYYSRNY